MTLPRFQWRGLDEVGRRWGGAWWTKAKRRRTSGCQVRSQTSSPKGGLVITVICHDNKTIYWEVSWKCSWRCNPDHFKFITNFKGKVNMSSSHKAIKKISLLSHMSNIQRAFDSKHSVIKWIKMNTSTLIKMDHVHFQLYILGLRLH